jgi:allantoin racemase
MKKISFILPVNNPNILTAAHLEQAGLASNAHYKIVLPRNELLEICNAEQEALATNSIVEAGLQEERNGADAVIVYCFGEPGVKELKKLLSIPVVGIAESAMQAAAKKGAFCVIASMQAHCPLIEKLADYFQLTNTMLPPICINLSPNEISQQKDRFIREAAAIIALANRENKADTFVLGCGSMQLTAKTIKQTTEQLYNLTVEIIDPLIASLEFIRQEESTT